MGTTSIGTGLLDRPEYAFLRENKHLGKQLILLGIGGSISYGTNIDDSDIDLRGIALNRREELIGLETFEQYTDSDTDSVIYSLGKIIPLFVSCNPNTIELLGLRPEHYLYLSECGKLLLENRKLFLSRKAIQSFGGYADAQLRRMQNALARDTYPQTEKEKHIFNSVKNAMFDFNSRFRTMENGGLRIYIDEAVHPELETEIFVDGDLRHYPLRDYKGMWSVMGE